MSSPVMRGQATRDELAIKVTIAATLPGSDAAAVIATQRSASEEHLASLHRLRSSQGDSSPESLAWSLVVDSMILSTDAELRWLDHVETRLAEHPQHALALELTADRPKRGRPTGAANAALA